MKTDPGSIAQTLADIDTDLADRMNDIESSARSYFRAKRDYEYEFAQERLRFKMSSEKLTQTDLDNKTVVELYNKESYKTLVVAESDYEAAKAAIRVLETRVGIGQSLLRMQREL